MTVIRRLGVGFGLMLLASSVEAQAVSVDSVRGLPSLDSSSLQPGDVLRLRIWREPDLSGDFPVDETGTAVLPRLGPTSVTGVPAETLKRQLVESYRQYLNNPSIEVTPLRRIAVLGAVRNPGVYPVDPSVTLGGAANLAGGPTSDSKRNVVELRRGTAHQKIDLKKHPELASMPLSSGDQVYLPQQSWLSQHATWFVSTLVGVAGTAAILIAR